MKFRSLLSPLLLAPLLLAGCGQPDSDAGPGGVTQGEAQSLDEAAAMLDERPVAPAEPSRETAEKVD